MKIADKNALRVSSGLKTGRFIQILLLALSIVLGVLSVQCSNKSRNLEGIFVDGLERSLGISLFTLLDDYPALKNAMTKLGPGEFNARLNDSLVVRIQWVPGSLRGLQRILSSSDSNLREALGKLSQLIRRIRTNDKEAYIRVLPLLDRIRRGPGNLVPSLIPIQNRGLLHLFETRSQESLDASLDRLISILSNPENTETFRDLENLLYKALTRSEGLSSGFATLLQGLFQGEDPRKGDFRSALAETLGGLGNSFGRLAGNGSGTKPSGLVLKELIRNIRNFTMVGGSFFASGPYNTPGHSARFDVYLEDLYLAVRRIILTPANLLKHPNTSLLSGLATNYHALGFPGDLKGIDRSLAQMGEVDLKGRKRFQSGSDPVSALEHLFFTLSLIDKFGYFWDNDPARPQILSHSNGILTIGDALHSLSSKLITGGVFVREGTLVASNNTITLTGSNPNTSDLPIGYELIAQGVKSGSTIQSKTSNTVTVTCSTPPPCVTASASNVVLTFLDGDPNSPNSSVANLGIGAILWLASISDHVRKDGAIFRFNLNTPALTLLEGESRGPIGGSNDPIYTRTIPWALGLLTDVLYSGKGPYFNKNRVDGSGNILTPDGKIYRTSGGQDQTYKQTWTTSRYAIPALNKDDSTLNRWVGLGGFTGGDGTNSNPFPGTSYTIREISIPESERAQETDEEAFYKNFQWLLYQKRMVIIIPVAIDALGGELREAAYVTIIGNGLRGLMEVKPFCSATNCVVANLGRWLKSSQFLKTNYKIPQKDLETFSDVPGDSVFLLEVWGFGLSGTFFDFTDDTILNQVFTLLFPKKNAPQDFYGPIPPAIRWNFEAIERLGFTTEGLVTPNQVLQNWERRNRLLPLIAALAKTLKDQADSNPLHPKNSYFILSSLADVLARPYRLDGTDPTANLDTNDNSTPDRSVSVPLFRVRGYSGVFGIRSPSMPDANLYYPDSNLRSPFSILLENQRRQNDGLLNLIGKGDLLTGLGRFLYELGREENASARERFQVGLGLILNEIRPGSEIQNSSQINLTDAISDLMDFILDEVDPSGARLSQSQFQKPNLYDDLAEFVYDFLSLESPYGYSENVEGILHSISFAKPSFGEMQNFLRLLASLFVDTHGNQDYFLTGLLQTDLPKVLQSLRGNSRPLIGLLEGLTRPNGFLGWFWSRAVSDYPANSVLSDLERFLVSSEVQTEDRGKNDLFYNAGELFGLFARMVDSPRVPGSMPHWFPDHWNRSEPVDTVFDRLNFLLSKK